MAKVVKKVSGNFIVSERLPLSDMFNFEIKKYIPYIVVTAILLIALIPIRQLKKPREKILLTLEIFTLWIFPPIFFYVIQGLTKFTIILIAFSCSTTTATILTDLSNCTKVPKDKRELIWIVTLPLSILIALIFPPLFSYAINGISKMTIIVSAYDWSIIASIILTFLISRDESKKLIAILTFVILFTLISIIYPPLFLYAAESFNSVTITFLILFEIFVFTAALTCISAYIEGPFVCCMIVSGLIMLSIAIYGLVVAIKSGFDKFKIIIIVVNFVVGIILPCLNCILIGKIGAYILIGIDFYILFYSMQSEVNPISLLLFWSDLWTMLSSIYIAIEKYIRREEVEFAIEKYIRREEVEFNVENYTEHDLS